MSIPELESEPFNSHYGYPKESTDFWAFMREMPVHDSYDIYGFSWTIDSLLQSKVMFGILEKIYDISGQDYYPSAGPKQINTIEINSFKSAVKVPDVELKEKINTMIENKESLLNLFSAI